MSTSPARTRLRVLTGREELPSLLPIRTALSLYCHTHYSQEILDLVQYSELLATGFVE